MNWQNGSCFAAAGGPWWGGRPAGSLGNYQTKQTGMGKRLVWSEIKRRDVATVSSRISASAAAAHRSFRGGGGGGGGEGGDDLGGGGGGAKNFPGN